MNNKELINSSLEMKHHRIYALVYGGLLVFLFVITTTLSMLDIQVYIAFGLGVPYAVVLLPLTVYHIYKMCSLTEDADGYESYTATLDEVHHTWGRNIYLILRVEKPNGTTFRAITGSIFSGSVLSDLYYGEFYSRKIDILYNENTDRTIVLGHDGII